MSPGSPVHGRVERVGAGDEAGRQDGGGQGAHCARDPAEEQVHDGAELRRGDSLDEGTRTLHKHTHKLTRTFTHLHRGKEGAQTHTPMQTRAR